MNICRINPDLYHRKNSIKPFFEGWYFKIADFENVHPIAIIPGIFKGTNQADSHSFIQILDGKDNKYSYTRFSEKDFSCNKSKLNISIGENNFSLNGIKISLDHDGGNINGDIAFNNVRKWPDTIFNPGSMGFFNYIPNLQCYSQVCAMDIKLSGFLNINGEKVNFTEGKGYIEKNWGNSFPFSWIWVQSNCFKSTNTSISCSIGDVPFGFTRFNGFIVGLFIDDKFYSFTTMNRSKAIVEHNGKDVKITISNKKYLLNIDVNTDRNKFMLCMGPKESSMIPLVEETLNGIINIKLKDNITEKVILKDTGICSGIEYGGEKMGL
jgi:tocopherol cyclase